ncbi:outer membrane protein assembly factor BamC [Thalassotalea sp. G2M2-11]|uniref:outer membrane protein assembly factor BamC n=1 Tax=Thalassotalea sp. G2M2-11 TaxID=2787627 RepID=UPI0019D24BF7|nr:outer membrane protein assembly factor BamC [Thalassotalea sp. G2M2-11]
MNRKVFYFSLLSMAVAGCSSINNKQASGDFDYASQQEAQLLVIPAGLDKPKQASDYYITDKINHKGPIGSEVDVRAPSLVLPIAASSRVESNNELAKIWFDQVLDDVDLQSFIYQALEQQLASDGVSMDTIDAENNIYESQWYNKEKKSGFWLFEEVDSTESLRFRFQFETKPHGRSVALMVSLVDYLRSDESGESAEMNLLDKQRAEMAMLNEIVAQVDYEYRKLQQENRLLRANQKLVSIGQNADQQPAYIVQMPIDLLWANMPIFFEDFGFTVADLNETKKIYYVDFVKPSMGLWDRIWGDEVPVIDIAEQRYQFVLAADENNINKTSLTIVDAQGEPLSNETLTNIFKVIEPGLSFREVY